MFKKAFWIFGTIFVSGVICNLTVVIANDGKMPVVDFDPESGSKRHQLLTPESKLVFLADIYKYRVSDGVFKFSIGDVFLLISHLPLAFFMLVYLVTRIVAIKSLKLIATAPSPIRFF